MGSSSESAGRPMTRSLPVPLSETVNLERSRPAPANRLREVAQWVSVFGPTLADLLPRFVGRERFPSPAGADDAAVLVEAVSIRLFERSDGTKEWQLEHVNIERPRRRRQPGFWLLALSCLGALALALARTNRLERWIIQRDR